MQSLCACALRTRPRQQPSLASLTGAVDCVKVEVAQVLVLVVVTATACASVAAAGLVAVQRAAGGAVASEGANIGVAGLAQVAVGQGEVGVT